MKRLLILLYGLLAYVVFLSSFLYAVGFVGNIVVPKSIDAAPTQPLWVAILINAALLGLFAVQHSVMARPAFKRWWTRIIPPAAERSTYVLFSSLALIVMFVFWQPMGGTIWHVDSPIARAVLYAGCAAGWALVLVSTFLINHFDLFGLRQVWLHFQRKPYTWLHFATPGPYQIVRHPLYVGFILAFWLTPEMTSAHLLFALLTTGYILVAVRLEERDLLTYHGAAYAEYMRRVPRLLPRLGRRWKPGEISVEDAAAARPAHAG